MKKIFILPVVLIFSLLTLLSCSKGDDDNTVDSSESLIQGLWILKVRTKDGVTYPLTPCEKKFSNLEFAYPYRRNSILALLVKTNDANFFAQVWDNCKFHYDSPPFNC